MICNGPLFIATTAGTVIGAFLHVIVKYLVSLFFKENERTKHLKREMSTIRSEMSQISMMDEFARHARLQRKLNKLQEEWKNQVSIQSSAKLKYKFITSTSASIVMGVYMLALCSLYRSEPVLLLPESWLSPISGLLAWPSGQPGAVSVLSWLAVCGYTARHVASKLS